MHEVEPQPGARDEPDRIDVGIFPWTMAMLGWGAAALLGPGLLMSPTCAMVLAVFVWPGLVGASLVVALLLVLESARRRRRASPFTVRALRSASFQSLLVGLAFAGWWLLYLR